jgi:glycosyltransferase involved in cell wall biosynthesis
MQVTYTAPNRAHHYRYAAALARAGCLHRFVSGFSRFSPRDALSEVGDRLTRADHFQNLYLASLKLRWPVSDELAYLSKCWLDRLSTAPARASDLFLFYSGAGLHTTRRLAESRVVNVVEAVNSHVLVQQEIMREEYSRLGRTFRPFHPREVARRLEEYALADAILCPSTFVQKSFVAQGIPPERIAIVPYGIDPAPVSDAPPKSGDNFRVLYVGQIDIRKGLRYLFEAFDRLNHPGKELWIVGPATGQTGLEGIATPAGARFLGVLKGEELARAYREASVFVLPTIEEGLALVLGEALSFGLPVVTTVNSGGDDLFTDGVEGFIVPIRSGDALREKLEQLAGQPELREKMSIAARARSRGLQSWEETGTRLVKTLATLRKATPR